MLFDLEPFTGELKLYVNVPGVGVLPLTGGSWEWPDRGRGDAPARFVLEVDMPPPSAQETFACLGGCGASVPGPNAYCSACLLRERQAVCDRAAHLADVPTPLETRLTCQACGAVGRGGAGFAASSIRCSRDDCPTANR
jgi:hypothetical protein